MSMFSDPNWKIRKISAQYLKSMFTLIPKSSIQQTFYIEIRELLNDEDIYVKLQALESYLDMLNLFESDDIEKDVLEVFNQLLLRVEAENFIKFAELSGKLIYTLNAYDIDAKCQP